MARTAGSASARCARHWSCWSGPIGKARGGGSFRCGRRTRMSDETMPGRAPDPDEAPKLDSDWFEEADAYVGDRLVRRGRPSSDNPKRAVSLRLDADVVEAFKREGAGWQTRMNDALRK